MPYRNELELLVAVMLSAQTTDVNVNRVTETLFEKYRRPYLAVPLEELERDIYPTGFVRQKAKALVLVGVREPRPVVGPYVVR